MNRYLIVIGGTLIVVFGLYRWGHHNGWAQRDAEMQTEIAKKNEEARLREQELRKEINDVNNTLTEANNALEQESSALQRAIRAGRVRISQPAPSCVQTSPSPAAPAGDRNETPRRPDRAPDEPSDAERTTLAVIAELVAQGDRNTNQLNACIDAYNKVMGAVNGQR
jgi:uncharacterized phage infection (PIP) family protein YhgE